MEDVRTHIDNCQKRFIARCVEDPSNLGDMLPVGFGDEGGGAIDDEWVEEGKGRRWNAHGPQWVGKNGKRDGFASTLTRKASALPETKPLCEGSLPEVGD